MSRRAPRQAGGDERGLLPGLGGLSLNGHKSVDIEGRCYNEPRTEYDRARDIPGMIRRDKKPPLGPDELRALDTPRDGECMFHAMAAMLMTPTFVALEGYESPNRARNGDFLTKVGGGYARLLVCDYIMENADHYGGPDYFLDGGLLGGNFTERKDDESNEDYVRRYVEIMEKPGAFGGDTELDAASELFNCNIVTLALDREGSGVVNYIHTFSPCRRWETDGDGHRAGDYKRNDRGEYESLTVEELSKLDTLVFLLVFEYSPMMQNWIPHYQAIYYSDPERLRVFMTNKVKGDITTDKMREREVPVTLSVMWQNDKVREIADVLTCGRPHEQVTNGLPANLVEALVRAALIMAENRFTQKSAKAAKQKEKDDAAVARARAEGGDPGSQPGSP